MRNILPAGVFSEITGAIYDCALAPDRWPMVLHMLQRELDFATASISLFDLPSGAIRLNIIEGVEQLWLQRIADYSNDMIMQWGGPAKILTYPIDEPQVLSLSNPESLSDKNRYYLEWAKPQGLIDLMGLPLVRDTASLGAIGLGRHKDAGPITGREIEIARLLLPHLQRAIAISRLLGIQAVTAATFDAVINALTAAVILTDGDLHIVHANEAAAAMLAAGDLITTRAGRFCISPPGANKALATAIAQIVQDASKLGGKGLGIPILRNDGSRHILHVLPIHPCTSRADIMPSAVAAIFVAPAATQRPRSAGVMTTLFGLTPMEARVLDCIVAGQSNAEIAKALNIGASTLKTHMLHLFDKTGVHRQAELVALATSFSLPLKA